MGNKKISKQKLIDKLDERIRLAQIVIYVWFVLFAVYNILRIFKPDFPNIANQTTILILLFCIPLIFLDIFKIFVKLIELDKNNIES